MTPEAVWEEFYLVWLSLHSDETQFKDDQLFDNCDYQDVEGIKKNMVLTIRFWAQCFNEDDYLDAISYELKEKVYFYKMRLRVAENNIINQVFIGQEQD
jgi:hypothetical protein